MVWTIRETLEGKDRLVSVSVAKPSIYLLLADVEP